MNDFTKDELILILGFLRGAYSVSNNVTELKAEKIQSMIDNKEKQESCIHEWEYEFNDYHCLKCGLRR
jgi:hypothetical protein